jgi:transcriptional regulator with XRE-family HTH domain
MTDKQLHDNRMQLGQRIAEIRNERGLSQQEVADAAGMKRPHVARVEGGKFNVGIDILAKIAAALQCDIEFSPK